MGDWLDSLLSRGTGQPLLSRQVIWSVRRWDREVRMSAFVLEIEAFGRALQSFPGWWQVVSKPLVCADEICVSCRTGCACACRRGVSFVGRHWGQLMREEGQEGKVFCFPSVCLVQELLCQECCRCTAKKWAESGKWGCSCMYWGIWQLAPLCVVRQDPHHNQKVWWVCVIVGTENTSLRSHGEICWRSQCCSGGSAVFELSFQFMVAILGCAHFHRAFSLVTQC